MFSLFGAIGCLLGIKAISTYQEVKNSPSYYERQKMVARDKVQKLRDFTLDETYDMYKEIYEDWPPSRKYLKYRDERNKICMYYMILDAMPLGYEAFRDIDPCWLCYENERMCCSRSNNFQLRNFGYMQDIDTWTVYGRDDPDLYALNEYGAAVVEVKDLEEKYFGR